MFGGNQFQYQQSQQTPQSQSSQHVPTLQYQSILQQPQQHQQQSQQSPQQLLQQPQQQQQSQYNQTLNYQPQQTTTTTTTTQFNYNPSYQTSPINERSTIQTQPYDHHLQTQQQHYSPQNNQSYYQRTIQPNSTQFYNDPNSVVNYQKNFTKEDTESYIENSFKNKIKEWRKWTFNSALFIYLTIIFTQLVVSMLLFSASPFSKSDIIKIGFYLLIQVTLCFTHSLVIGVYRQVPAGFKEFLNKFTFYHLGFLLMNLAQFYSLFHYFSLISSFKITVTKEVCFEDASDGYIVKCQTESNIFFPLTFILSILLTGSIIFKSFSNQEFILSFPKANIPTILQIKSTLYNGFWISFYSSFNFFCIGSILSVLLFILYRTFTFKIILYLCHLWCYSFIIIFQNFIRYRIFEIYFTRSLRFSVEKFAEPQQSLHQVENSNAIRHINTPTVENPNVFLYKAIESEDPLVQFLAWKDLLFISKYSESRRNQLFSEVLQMFENPTLLKIISKYEEQIYNLDAIFSTPREFYEPNYKKDDGDKNNRNSSVNNNKKNKLEINFNFFGKTIKKMITQVTGIKFEYNPYDSEIKQALSNTQSVLWSIEAIGSLIVSAQNSHDPQVMEHLHRYQVPQKFLAPLLRIVSIVEKLESDLQFQVEMDRSTLIQDYYFIKSLINQIEPPKNCFGILQTSRPHFRLFKQVGKNTISQVLETIGNQISDISLPHDLRPLLNRYKNGEFSIYQ